MDSVSSMFLEFGRYLVWVVGASVLGIFIVGGLFTWGISPYPSQWSDGMVDGPPDYSRRTYTKRQGVVLRIWGVTAILALLVVMFFALKFSP